MSKETCFVLFFFFFFVWVVVACRFCLVFVHCSTSSVFPANDGRKRKEASRRDSEERSAIDTTQAPNPQPKGHPFTPCSGNADGVLDAWAPSSPNPSDTGVCDTWAAVSRATSFPSVRNAHVTTSETRVSSRWSSSNTGAVAPAIPLCGKAVSLFFHERAISSTFLTKANAVVHERATPFCFLSKPQCWRLTPA